MGNVINFSNKVKGDDFEETLSKMMKDARSIEKRNEVEKAIHLSSLEELEKIIRTSIFDVLVEANCQNSDYFNCGKYISTLIKKTVSTPPESFYVIDYLDKIETEEEFYYWQKAADMCFLLCSIFTGRCNHGMMTYNSYLLIGKSLYSTFYSKSKKKIGYLMSINYRNMVEVTQEAVKTLS